MLDDTPALPFEGLLYVISTRVPKEQPKRWIGTEQTESEQEKEGTQSDEGLTDHLSYCCYAPDTPLHYKLR